MIENSDTCQHHAGEWNEVISWYRAIMLTHLTEKKAKAFHDLDDTVLTQTTTASTAHSACCD